MMIFHTFSVILMSSDCAGQVIFVIFFSFHSILGECSLMYRCIFILEYPPLQALPVKHLDTTGHKLVSRILTYLCKSIFPTPGPKLPTPL